MAKTRKKTLGKAAMLRNINGLSCGDRAYCGPYGTIECTKPAYWLRRSLFEKTEYFPKGKAGGRSEWVKKYPRKFKVSGSRRLANRGNWTWTALRAAILKEAE